MTTTLQIQQLEREARQAARHGRNLFRWLAANKRRIKAAAIATNYDGVLWIDLMRIFCGSRPENTAIHRSIL